MKHTIAHGRLINRFNDASVHLVITEWPEKTSGKKSYSGVAGFAKETLYTLARRKNMRFVVLAETGTDNRPQTYLHGKILVLRVFDHQHPSLYPTILTWLARFPKIRHVTVHSEFGACAGLRHFVLLLPFLALVKLTGRRISFFAHNVIDKVDFLAPHLNISRNRHFLRLFNKALGLYYRLLGALSDETIVLDINGYTYLSQKIKTEKLIFNPHWVKPRVTHWTKAAAKKALGISDKTAVITAFGFVSQYKGSDILLKLFKKKAHGTNYRLIFAGGIAPSRKDNPEYQRFFSKFEKDVAASPHIEMTGFVPDAKLGLYFAASDLVVLPYRGLMGGSGTLAYAIGYHKPFLVSTAMKSLWKNADIKTALTSLRLEAEDLMFPLNSYGMEKILRVANDQTTLRRLTRFSGRLRLARDIEPICDRLYNEVYARTADATNPSAALAIQLDASK